MERNRKILIIGGAIVLVLILIAIGIFAMNSAAKATSATPTSTTVAAQSKAKIVNPYTQPLKQYSPTIKNQIAQGLKLTTDQIATQLKAGKSLSDIATAQGLSATQLQNLIAASLQNGLNPAITSGELTQKQVTTLIKRWEKNPKQLEHLLGAKLKKAITTTPVVEATPTP